MSCNVNNNRVPRVSPHSQKPVFLKHLWNKNFAYIPYITLRTRSCWLSLPGNSVICILFLDFLALRSWILYPTVANACALLSFSVKIGRLGPILTILSLREIFIKLHKSSSKAYFLLERKDRKRETSGQKSIYWLAPEIQESAPKHNVMSDDRERLCTVSKWRRGKKKLLQKGLSVLCSNEQSTHEDGLIIEPTRSNKNWHGLVSTIWPITKIWPTFNVRAVAK